MKISELAARTAVPVATLKYYLREGLLQPGTATSRTQATYDEAHVERVTLIRALTGVGGLSLSAARSVIVAATDPHATAFDAMAASSAARDQRLAEDGPPDRAARWLRARGWLVEPDDPAVAWLDAAWRATNAAGVTELDETRLDAYADAAHLVAQADLAAVPDDPLAAVREVVVGTVLTDPVLLALRRMAQQHLARRQAGECAPEASAVSRSSP